LYQPCEPQGRQAKNYAKPDTRCCKTPPLFAVKLVTTALCAENRRLRTVLASMRIPSQPKPFAIFKQTAYNPETIKHEGLKGTQRKSLRSINLRDLCALCVLCLLSGGVVHASQT
jgi:hypothetical protein